MKYVSVVIFVCVFQQGSAQYASLLPRSDQSLARHIDLSFMSMSSNKVPGRGMRNSGRVLTIFGGVLFAGSIAAFATAAPGGIDSGGGAQRILAFAIGAPSAVFILTPGVILWTKGARRMKSGTEQKVVINLNGRCWSEH